MEARLIIVGGKVGKKQIRLKLPSVIGRSREADLTIAHPMVSRQHCEFYEAQGLLRIRDLGSLNGTFIGDKQISEAALRPADEFTVGPLTFRVDYDYAGDPTAESPSVPDFHLGTAGAQGNGIGGPAEDSPLFMEPAPPVAAPADDATGDYVPASVESPPPLFGQWAPQEPQQTPPAEPAKQAYPDFSAWDQPVEQPAGALATPVAGPAALSPSVVEQGAEEEEEEPEPTPPPPYPRPQRIRPLSQAAPPQQPEASTDQANANPPGPLPAPEVESGEGAPGEIEPVEEAQPVIDLAAPVEAVPVADPAANEQPPPQSPDPKPAAQPAEKKRGWWPFRREKKGKAAVQAPPAAVVPATAEAALTVRLQSEDQAPDSFPQQGPAPEVQPAPAAASDSEPPVDPRVPPVQVQPPGQSSDKGEDGLDPELDAFLRGFEMTPPQDGGSFRS